MLNAGVQAICRSIQLARMVRRITHDVSKQRLHRSRSNRDDIQTLLSLFKATSNRDVESTTAHEFLQTFFDMDCQANGFKGALSNKDCCLNLTGYSGVNVFSEASCTQPHDAFCFRSA